MSDESDQQAATNEGRVPSKIPTWAKFAVAVVLLVAVVLGIVLWQVADARSPRASIGKLATAVVRGDVSGVNERIDAASVVGGAIDELYDDPHFRESLLASYMAAHPGVTKDDIKTKAESLVAEELEEHVKSGTIPKRIPLSGTRLKYLVASAYARHAVKSVVVDGSVAHATIEVPYAGRKLLVKVRLVRSATTWKISAIENLTEVLRAAGF